MSGSRIVSNLPIFSFRLEIKGLASLRRCVASVRNGVRSPMAQMDGAEGGESNGPNLVAERPFIP